MTDERLMGTKGWGEDILCLAFLGELCLLYSRQNIYSFAFPFIKWRQSPINPHSFGHFQFQMNSSKFIHLSQFFAIIFNIFYPNFVFAADTWPCLQLPTGNQCHDGTPCVTSTTTLSGLACPSPACSTRDDCEPFDCDTAKSPPQCEDFQERRIGDGCSTHIECGPDKLCNNLMKCMATSGSPFFGSSFLRCIVGATPSVCIAAEECQANPSGTTGKGVCLKKSTNAQILKDLLTGTTKSPMGGGGTTPSAIANGGGEGTACTYMVTKCATPFVCEKDGICRKTTQMKSEITGHRIPPPPGNPNCRDALDSAENDENKSKCKDREQLCTQPLYVELMKEQCPKTCGYCDDPSLDLSEYAEEIAPAGGGVQRTSGGGVKTVKVDPSATCSDRKLPDKESDCPNLKQLCNDPIYKSLLQEECPKTCGFCTG